MIYILQCLRTNNYSIADIVIDEKKKKLYKFGRVATIGDRAITITTKDDNMRRVSIYDY